MLRLAVSQVNTMDFVTPADCPIHCFLTRSNPHAARADGNQANRHPELRSGALLRSKNPFQCFVPVQLMTAESPIGRKSNLQEFNILPGCILEQFPRDALHYR